MTTLTKFQAIATEMIHDSGVWKELRTYDTRKEAGMSLFRLRRGQVKTLSAPGYEFEARQDGHRWTVWGRYVK